MRKVKGSYARDMDDDSADPYPAAAGTPPPRPPTAIGAGDEPPERRHEDLNLVLLETLRYLMFPLDRIGFDARTIQALRSAGIDTLGDLLVRASDERIERLDIEATTLSQLLEWRGRMRL